MAENKNARTSADGPVAWGCQCGRVYTVTCISSKPQKHDYVIDCPRCGHCCPERTYTFDTAPPKAAEWFDCTDAQLIDEVRRRGFVIRDAQIEPAVECMCGICKLGKREWVGLTDEDIHDAFNFTEMVKQLSWDREPEQWCENFAAYIEAKIKDKNHG